MRFVEEANGKKAESLVSSYPMLVIVSTDCRRRRRREERILTMASS